MLANPLKTAHPLWLLLGLAALAAGLWLVFWPPALANLSSFFVFGGPLVGLGSTLAAIQIALWRKTGFEHATAPDEANAWVKLLFLAALIVVSLGNADALAAGISGVDAMHLGIKLVVMAVFYVVLAHLLRVRQGEAVLEDERDAEISTRAAAWGRMALIFVLVGLMVMLGLSTPETLQWATPPMIALQLWFALLWGWLVEYVAVVLFHWRDRSGQ
jgi:uncharacterized membrane protein